MSTDRTRINFRVYGLEFCRMLGAVGLFQATPRDSDVYSQVRCVAGTGGLSMYALNLRAAAAGHVDIEHEDGAGMFSIPSVHVKGILAIFKRKLPKERGEDEYVLEVTVTERAITIADVSELFAGDVLTVTVPEPVVEHGDEPESEAIRRTAIVVQKAIEEGRAKADLTAGYTMNPVEVGRVAKAAQLLGVVMEQWPLGRTMVIPLGDSFTATLMLGKAADDEERPLQGERTISEWRTRLEDFIDHGVI